MDPLHFIWRRFAWPFLTWLRSNYNARTARRNYARLLSRLSHLKFKTVKVVFLVSESSKWKYDALFKALADNPRYDPMVLLTCANIDWQLNKEERKGKLEINKAFFDQRGFNYELAYDYQIDVAIPLKEFYPDVVFYEEPWYIVPCQAPLVVSRYALTFYVPYFLPTYGWPELEYCQDFHRYIFRHIVLNQGWADYYERYQGKYLYAGKLLPLGHPMLDVYWQMAQQKKSLSTLTVIYAPHWSIPHPKNKNTTNLSTFLETGKPILEYALKHPEIKWVFKPHPSLRTILYKILSRHEVDDYYEQWEHLGMVCYTGDYVKLFFESHALITDCDSFLIEYVFSGRPIIHLKRNGYNEGRNSPFNELFDTYYKVCNVSELEPVIDSIVLKHNDPNKQRRLELMRTLGLCQHDISAMVVKNLDFFFFNGNNLDDARTN